MDKKDLKDAIEKIEWRHGTRTETGQGISYMRDMQMKSARPNAAHVCIVITDGESQEYEVGLLAAVVFVVVVVLGGEGGGGGGGGGGHH